MLAFCFGFVVVLFFSFHFSLYLFVLTKALQKAILQLPLYYHKDAHEVFAAVTNRKNKLNSISEN